MANSTYLDNALVNAMVGKTTFTAPANVYIGLSTTAPTTAGSNITEPVGNGYARVPVPGSSWNSASNGTATNSAAITFPTATGSWGTATYIVAYDAASSGNYLWSSAISGGQAVVANVTVVIPVGSASVSMS